MPVLRDYELMFIISPEVVENDLSGVIERVSQSVNRAGGEVAGAQPWGRRRLTYPIRHFREGSYVLMRLKLDPKQMTPLERSLALTEEVIRHLLVRLDVKEKLSGKRAETVVTVVSEAKGESE